MKKVTVDFIFFNFLSKTDNGQSQSIFKVLIIEMQGGSRLIFQTLKKANWFLVIVREPSPRLPAVGPEGITATRRTRRGLFSG